MTIANAAPHFSCKGHVPVIAEALGRGLPVLTGVNGLNLAAFLKFASEEVPALPTKRAVGCKLMQNSDLRRGRVTTISEVMRANTMEFRIVAA